MGVPSGTRTNENGGFGVAFAAVLADAVGDRTTASVGRAAGIERTLLSRMLAGTKVITIDEAWRICEALGVSLRTLVTRAEQSRNSSELPGQVARVAGSRVDALVASGRVKSRDVPSSRSQRR